MPGCSAPVTTSSARRPGTRPLRTCLERASTLSPMIGPTECSAMRKSTHVRGGPPSGRGSARWSARSYDPVSGVPGPCERDRRGRLCLCLLSDVTMLSLPSLYSHSQRYYRTVLNFTGPEATPRVTRDDAHRHRAPATRSHENRQSRYIYKITPHCHSIYPYTTSIIFTV